jgi:hypothetical protein
MIKSRIKLFIELLVLLLFVGYYSGVTMFYHTHTVNGVTIVHSHPFLKHTDKQGHPIEHSHTREGFQFIQFTSHFVFTIFMAIVASSVFFILLSKHIYPIVKTFFHFDRDDNIPLRAPPVYL